MSAVLFLFLAHLGIGIAATLLIVASTAGTQFFRFNAGLAAVLLLVALAFRPAPVSINVLESVGFTALIVATGSLLVYWASLGRGLASLRPWLLWTTVVGGGLSSVQVPLFAALTVVSFLSSAALLGGACTAMILGHWYLVLPSMNISLLQSMVKFHIGSTIVRTVVVVAVVAVALSSWQAPSGAGYGQYAVSLDGVFLWQRLLFGLASPSVLSYLVWQTAKIQSTQSATGILYVDFFTIVVGEVLAKYLLLSTQVPV